MMKYSTNQVNYADLLPIETITISEISTYITKFESSKKAKLIEGSKTSDEVKRIVIKLNQLDKL
ncbi:CLUMA_CG009155, isoform A [Clunio marinus]|uniref:CLUMA_CG009155, isoform A n=1 Tax=Clunio marinus TaxID=568069 RepID=A0A1J1IB78_9DIPT|nr:CLUMA_CG009155, isoform A [Clunio marinus]